MPLVHHELCFGCGRANLFGLSLELEEVTAGAVAGRCFLKQDHQGADRGFAHQGVLAAALCEAMALACGLNAHSQTVQIELFARAPVGVFLEVQARAEPATGGSALATAVASSDRLQVASARGTFRY